MTHQTSAFPAPFTYRIYPVFSLLFALLLSACTTTPLTSPPLETTLFKLAALAPRPVHLVAEAAEGSLRVGHQYLLLAIPFGSIELTDPVRSLERAAFTELALAGVRPVIGPTGDGLPRFVVRVKDIGVSAYDLIVTRRVTATVTLEASLPSKGGSAPTLIETTSTHGSYERFGFAPQLSAALDEALHGAVRDAVLALQTSDGFRYH